MSSCGAAGYYLFTVAGIFYYLICTTFLRSLDSTLLSSPWPQRRISSSTSVVSNYVLLLPSSSSSATQACTAAGGIMSPVLSPLEVRIPLVGYPYSQPFSGFNDLSSHNLSHHSPHYRPRNLHPTPQQPFHQPRFHLPDIPPRHRSPHLPALGRDCCSDAKT